MTQHTPSHPSPQPRSRSRSSWTWRKKLLIGLLVLANLAVFGAWASFQYVTRKLDAAIPRNEAVVPELSEAPEEPSEPVTFLIIGSDSRESLPDDFEGNFGAFGGQRADVIMLMKVYPDSGTAQLLSLPRDLRVEIDGHGVNKINAAYAFGEGPLMVRTVRQVTGLPVHHYLEVDFVGFSQIVDEIGGVHIAFPNAARDTKSGFAVDAGTEVLDGPAALAYARSRSYQELRDGQWQSVGADDIGRTERQQDLVFAILSELKSPSSITEVGGLIDALGDNVTVDSALDRGALVDLAWALRTLRSTSIEAATYPTVSERIDGIWFELPDEPAAGAMLEAFRTGRPLTESDDADPGSVSAAPTRVQILNGNGGEGVAKTWADHLEQFGVDVVGVGDAPAFDFEVTQLIVPEGNEQRGSALAEHLGFGEVALGAVPTGVDVLVIVGMDAPTG